MSMMATHNLLVELFVEELPPKALKKLGEAFGGALQQGLRAQGLADEQSGAQRLRVAAPAGGAHQPACGRRPPDKAVAQKLMPVAVALDAGRPADAGAAEEARRRWAPMPACVPQLQRQPDGKAEALFLDSVVPGATLAAGLQKALDEALAKLPIPKVMSYQLEAATDFQPGWTSVHFVRPAHGLVALHGADVVPVHALGLQAGRADARPPLRGRVDPVVLQRRRPATQRQLRRRRAR